MALIVCKECGKQVSSSAMTCPHCGFPLKTVQTKAVFKCADNGGWNTGWIRRKCEIIDMDSGRTLRTIQMGEMCSITLDKKYRLKIHVHGYMSQPEIVLYPGKNYQVNIKLKMGGALGGGFCSVDCIEI